MSNEAANAEKQQNQTKLIDAHEVHSESKMQESRHAHLKHGQSFLVEKFIRKAMYTLCYFCLFEFFPWGKHHFFSTVHEYAASFLGSISKELLILSFNTVLTKINWKTVLTLFNSRIIKRLHESNFPKIIPGLLLFNPFRPIREKRANF